MRLTSAGKGKVLRLNAGLGRLPDESRKASKSFFLCFSSFFRFFFSFFLFFSSYFTNVVYFTHRKTTLAKNKEVAALQGANCPLPR